jgi:hypothetical protein
MLFSTRTGAIQQSGGTWLPPYAVSTAWSGGQSEIGVGGIIVDFPTCWLTSSGLMGLNFARSVLNPVFLFKNSEKELKSGPFYAAGGWECAK